MILNIVPSTTAKTPYIFNEEEAELVSPKLKEEYIKTIHLANFSKAKPVISSTHQPQIAEKVSVKKHIQHAILPSRSPDGAVGYDLTLSQEATLQPNSTTKIYTGISIAILQGMYG